MNKKNRALLLAYVGILFVGGLMGYSQGGSQISLIMASLFSLILLLLMGFARRIDKSVSYIAFTLLVLDSFFTYRFLKTWKFIPSGLFSLVTFGVIILFLKFSGRTQNKARREP